MGVVKRNDALVVKQLLDTQPPAVYEVAFTADPGHTSRSRVLARLYSLTVGLTSALARMEWPKRGR